MNGVPLFDWREGLFNTGEALGSTTFEHTPPELQIRCNRVREAFIPPFLQMPAQHILFQGCLIQSPEIRSIGKHLCDDSPTRFRIPCQLDLDNSQSPARLNRYLVRASASKLHLSTRYDQAWRTRQWHR